MFASKVCQKGLFSAFHEMLSSSTVKKPAFITHRSTFINTLQKVLSSEMLFFRFIQIKQMDFTRLQKHDQTRFFISWVGVKACFMSVCQSFLSKVKHLVIYCYFPPLLWWASASVFVRWDWRNPQRGLTNFEERIKFTFLFSLNICWIFSPLSSFHLN